MRLRAESQIRALVPGKRICYALCGLGIKVLGLETSCDETAAAVVEDGVQILSNVVASQVDIHARYGGVVPEVASRQHLLAIIPILKRALSDADVDLKSLSAVAVTIGPGLAGSLLVGVNLAKSLALAAGLPLIGVNHLEAHIYANCLESHSIDFPALCLIVSGGHTELVLMKDHGEYLLLGRTRDDAAGEAFDKVARLLYLGYPGGPAIERAARGASNPYPLPRAWLPGTHDFSFSGLKTAVLHLCWEQGISPDSPPELISRIAAGFQEAVVDVLVTKTIRAAEEYGARQILLGGGVASNLRFREELSSRSPLPVLIPHPTLCTDNAAMVASCAYFRFKAGRISSWDLDVDPSAQLG